MNAIVTRTAEAAEIVTRRAPDARVTTWNEDTWTFEITAATEAARVARWDMRGEFDERLDLSGQTWPETVPFLDSHRGDSVAHRIGSVDRFRAIGGELRARVTLSRSHPIAQQIASELAAGLPQPVSVGYVRREVSERTNPETKRREVVVTRFDLVEVSAVSVPADRLATSRGVTMPDHPAAPEAGTTASAAPPPTTTTTTAPETVNRASVNAEIRSLATSLGLPVEFANQHIDAGAEIAAVRSAALDEVVRRTTSGIVTTTPRIVVGQDHADPEVRARHMGEALYTRINPAHTPSEAARQYTGLSMVDMARDCLRYRGIAVTGGGGAEIVRRALHAVSDFPIILGDSVGRTLRDTYTAVPSALKALGRQVNAPDFRTRHRLALSEAPRLEKVNESGEIKAGTLVEAEETYKVATYARRVGLSRQAIVNDDLSVFVSLSRRLGQAAAATEAQLLVELLTANSGLGPTMADGDPLFHVDHGNVAPTPGTPWALVTPPAFEPLLAEARLLMRKQTGLSGELIAIAPRFLVVPSAGETAAEKILAAITPNTSEAVNVFAGRLTLVVEPRLTDPDAWYLAASPAEADGLEWSYLDGFEGPQVESYTVPGIDGVEVSVRLDFGAGFVDHRSWVRNAGS